MGGRSYDRKSKSKPPRLTFCIVAEGETEFYYFSDAKTEFDGLQKRHAMNARNEGVLQPAVASLVVKHAGGRSFVNVLTMALDEATLGHTIVWCVVDADFYVRLKGKARHDAEAVLKRARKAKIDVVFSRPCFEVWFRHHFNAETSAWIDGDTSKENIDAIWPDYRKKPSRYWDLLKDRLALAKANAKIVRRHHECPPKAIQDCDAASEVDRLIEELFSIDPNAEAVKAILEKRAPNAF